MRDLSGKRVLITGGASGIGRALAERIAAQGAHLVLVDRDAAARLRVNLHQFADCEPMAPARAQQFAESEADQQRRQSPVSIVSPDEDVPEGLASGLRVAVEVTVGYGVTGLGVGGQVAVVREEEGEVGLYI